jgi:hypothetical protein
VLIFYSLVTNTGLDTEKTVQRLRPTKSVGLEVIPGFIIKASLISLVPVLKHIFNLSAS